MNADCLITRAGGVPSASVPLVAYIASMFTYRAGLVLLSLFSSLAASTSVPQYHRFPPLRERASLEDSWTKQRLQAIPSLLAKHGVDAWIVCLSHLYRV